VEHTDENCPCKPKVEYITPSARTITHRKVMPKREPKS